MKMKRCVRYITLLLVVILAASLLGGCSREKKKLQITFFDQSEWIGEDWWDSEHAHGDCYYIELPDGINMLVDTSTAYSANFIRDRLLEMGVEKIDYFVASHLHQDHIGGFGIINKAIPVQHVIESGYGHDQTQDGADPTLDLVVSSFNIPTTTVRAGDTLDIGGAHFEFFWPTEAADELGTRSPLNENSMLFRMSYGEFSILCTGDIFTTTEDLVVDRYGDKLQSTVLKVPHHGHDTSTSDKFVNAVKPSFAVVMGMGIQYANTANNVGRCFSKRCIPVYGTYSDRDIHIETDGELITIDCVKGSNTWKMTKVADEKPEGAK